MVSDCLVDEVKDAGGLGFPGLHPGPPLLLGALLVGKAAPPLALSCPTWQVTISQGLLGGTRPWLPAWIIWGDPIGAGC